MSEIGPRFTLNLIKIFAGGLGGITLYENPTYQTPNAVSDYSIVNIVYQYYYCTSRDYMYTYKETSLLCTPLEQIS